MLTVDEADTEMEVLESIWDSSVRVDVGGPEVLMAVT